MSIVTSKQIVDAAAGGGYGISAFNTQGGHYDIVRAIVESAVEERSPVILMAYEKNLEYYGYSHFVILAKHLAESSAVPIALHLDHSESVDSIEKAIESGFTSVMIDYSKKPIEDNIRITREVIKMAVPHGISVEAEIGELQRTDADANQEPKNLVDVEDVRRFLEKCRPDMLAVGIGNAHGFYKGEPNIRIDLLKSVREVAQDVPLVLHGTTGIPEETVRECIRNGVAKVNFGTIIRYNYLDYFKKALGGAVEHKDHTWRIARFTMEQLKEDVRKILRLTMSEGKV